MDDNRKKKNKLVILIALLLMFLVMLSTIVYYNRMRNFLPSDTGAISLVGKLDLPEIEGSLSAGMEASDENGPWATQNTVEIFKITYDNETGESTVVSADEKTEIIAPGTENSYTFKFKNTGQVAIDYDLSIYAYISPSDVKVPVEVRLNRFDGYWLVGGKDSWESVEELDATYDSYTVGTMCHTYYTLDWRWPFESGDDELDTLIGDMATEEDITLTIEIATTAYKSENLYASGGIMPQTGDTNNIVLYGSLAACALMMMFILFYSAKEEKYENE